MLMRFDPFRDFDRVAQMLTPGATGVRPLTMPMDAYREGDCYIVHFDLPGVDPQSIDLTVEKNVLTVRAERSFAEKDGREMLVSERPQGTFTRQLFLGDGLDADRVQATYHDGVLTLMIPVAEQAKPRRVMVTSGNGERQPIEASASQ
ncbi:MAG: Hsp20/alpha crystallin family protein [Actinomycetota bacterium]